MEMLKKCPFCGGVAYLGGSDMLITEEDPNGHPYWYVVCNKCIASTCGDRNKDKAIANWNRRADDETV